MIGAAGEEAASQAQTQEGLHGQSAGNTQIVEAGVDALLAKVADALDADVAEATDEINRLRNVHIEEMISSRLADGGRVGILGLSYKPNTDVVEVRFNWFTLYYRYQNIDPYFGTSFYTVDFSGAAS